MNMPVDLPLDDRPGQDSAFNVEDGEVVVIHLLFRVQGHYVLSPADPVSHPLEDPVEHRHSTATPEVESSSGGVLMCRSPRL